LGADEVMSTSSSASTVSAAAAAKRLVASSSRDLVTSTARDLGILGLPPEKMTLVREKKDDIEKVECCSC